VREEEKPKSKKEDKPTEKTTEKPKVTIYYTVYTGTSHANLKIQLNSKNTK
jgi:hypothetical protein